MAGKIIADTIEASGSQISLNVGNVTVLTASSTGLTLTPTTNVNINVANSNVTFTTANITGVATFSTGSAALPSITTAGDPDTGIYFPSANTIGFTRGGIEVGRFDSNSANANFQFNSGYGSVATAYACRAWVNFNGTGEIAIRGSGNVNSITDVAQGQYNVNFTTAMPDANYAPTAITGYKDATDNNEMSWISLRRSSSSAFSTTACAITTGFTVSNAGSDNQYVCVAFFR